MLTEYAGTLKNIKNLKETTLQNILDKNCSVTVDFALKRIDTLITELKEIRQEIKQIKKEICPVCNEPLLESDASAMKHCGACQSCVNSAYDSAVGTH